MGDQRTMEVSTHGCPECASAGLVAHDRTAEEASKTCSIYLAHRDGRSAPASPVYLEGGWLSEGAMALCPECKQVKEGTVSWGLWHASQCDWRPAGTWKNDPRGTWTDGHREGYATAWKSVEYVAAQRDRMRSLVGEICAFVDHVGTKAREVFDEEPVRVREIAVHPVYEHPEVALDRNLATGACSVVRVDGKPEPTETDRWHALHFLRHEDDVTRSSLVRTNYFAAFVADMRAQEADECIDDIVRTQMTVAKGTGDSSYVALETAIKAIRERRRTAVSGHSSTDALSDEVYNAERDERSEAVESGVPCSARRGGDDCEGDRRSGRRGPVTADSDHRRAESAACEVAKRRVDDPICLAPIGGASPIPFPDCPCRRCGDARAAQIRHSIPDGKVRMFPPSLDVPALTCSECEKPPTKMYLRCDEHDPVRDRERAADPEEKRRIEVRAELTSLVVDAAKEYIAKSEDTDAIEEDDDVRAEAHEAWWKLRAALDALKEGP